MTITPIQLDLPTGTELGIKRRGNPTLNLQNCLSGRCHCLSGGSYSDNKASLASSEAVLELPTGTELGNKNIDSFELSPSWAIKKCAKPPF